jgi:cytochrome subunit of sulfide dehydrogenase
MRKQKSSTRLWIAAIGMLVSCSTWAVTALPGTVSLAEGANKTVKISSVSGTVTYANPKPAVISVTKVDTETYRINGLASGAAVVTFKDKKSTASVSVTVTKAAAVTLNGRLLASNCFQCHGTNGSGGFEKIAGKSASELYGELKEFANGKEDANGIMAAHAMGFSDAQLKSIANYFASVR